MGRVSGTIIMSPAPRSETYHERAQELREMAKVSSSAEARKEMLYLAEQYEKLAIAAAKIAAGGKI